MQKLEHIDYINGKLELTNTSKTNSIELVEILSSTLDRKYLFLPKDNRLVQLINKETKKLTLIYSDFIKSSGVVGNFSKRLHVIHNAYENLNDIKPIGVYNSVDKFLYIYFSDHNILFNKTGHNKSVWVDFSAICYALETGRDIKYKSINKTLNINYNIYLTPDLKKIIELDDSKFTFLTNEQAEHESSKIKDFYTKNVINNTKVSSDDLDNSLNEFDSDIDLSLFNKQENKLTSSMEKVDLYREAEELFYELLLSDQSFLEEKLNIQSINNYKWMNKEKESYLPYDFTINENVYIDVKCTEESRPTFYLSDTEYKFMNSCENQNNKYFVANLICASSSKKEWVFFNSNEINDMQCIEKIERKFFKE